MLRSGQRSSELLLAITHWGAVTACLVGPTSLAMRYDDEIIKPIKIFNIIFTGGDLNEWPVVVRESALCHEFFFLQFFLLFKMSFCYGSRGNLPTSDMTYKCIQNKF